MVYPKQIVTLLVKVYLSETNSDLLGKIGIIMNFSLKEPIMVTLFMDSP